MNNKLIDLYGHTEAIFYKGPKHMIVLFKDDSSGSLVCQIPKNNMLYNYLDHHKKYHLKVELMGTVYSRENGKESIRNNLVVRNAAAI